MKLRYDVTLDQRQRAQLYLNEVSTDQYGTNPKAVAWVQSGGTAQEIEDDPDLEMLQLVATAIADAEDPSQWTARSFATPPWNWDSEEYDVAFKDGKVVECCSWSSPVDEDDEGEFWRGEWRLSNEWFAWRPHVKPKFPEHLNVSSK